MRPRSRRRSLAGLVLAGFLLATGASGSARAQTATGSAADQFGGYKLNARGNGFLFSFDSPNLLPVGSPLFELGLPEAQATGANGPDRYALASLAYPGAILADLPSVIAQSGQNVPLPPYPIRTQSYYPSGPTSQRQEIATAQMETVTSEGASDATARYTAADLQSFFSTGGITVQAHVGVEDGQVVSRLRSEISGVNVLGVLTIDSVVTDIVANSNAQDAATEGTTTVTGARFLGLPVTIDADGVHFTQDTSQPTTTTQPGPLAPLLGNLPPLDLGGGLQPVATAVSSLITQVVGATGSVNDLLAQAGISVKLLSPLEVKDGAQASRTANGLLIEIRYNGRTEPLVSQLLGAVPSDQLPSDSLIPQVPLNTSPQALFNLLKETYVVDLALASGAVAVQASAPFAFSPTSGVSSAGGSSSGGSFAGASTPGFSTKTPGLTSTGGGGGASAGGGALGDLLPIGTTSGPLSALLLGLLVLLTGAAFGVGSARLADNALAAASASCPEGREPPGATYALEGGSP